MDDQGLDEETLNQMLGLSTVPEERKQLQDQLKMSQMLARGATDYNPYIGRGRGSRANVGGAFGALAQGMQGYMAGKGITEQRGAEGALQNREKLGRERWFRSRYGSGRQAGGGAPAATPNSYFDPGQPQVRMLPPEEELPVIPGMD